MTPPRPIGFARAAAHGDPRVFNTIGSKPLARAENFPSSTRNIGGGRYLVDSGPVIYGGEPINFRLEIRRPSKFRPVSLQVNLLTYGSFLNETHRCSRHDKILERHGSL